jgi:hypothetical protein
VVTGKGWPVTTPRELVSVKYWVAGLLYYSRGFGLAVFWLNGCVLVFFVLTSAVSAELALVVSLWAWARAMARVVKTMEKRILKVEG